MQASADSSKSVLDELRITRRNRYALAAGIFCFGLLITVSMDLAGDDGLATLIWIVIMSPAFYGIRRSKSREKDAQDFAAVGTELQHFGNDKNLPALFGYFVSPDGWFIKRTTFSFNYFSARDICWVYPSQNKVSTHGVHTDTKHGVVVRLASGKVLSEETENKGWRRRNEYSQVTLNRFEALQKLAPWAVFGYNKDLENKWNKERESFIDQVNRKREAIVSTLEKASPKT